MNATPHFALNHIVAPHLDYHSFFKLAVGLKMDGVELRNELRGTAIADGTPPEEIRDAATGSKLRILAINALRRFNQWGPDREKEARALVKYASLCGAEAIIICPVNDASFRPPVSERLANIRSSLAALKPILVDANVRGLIEVVGFPTSSLSRKREAVDAIDNVNGKSAFQLVHDSFHHFLARDPDIFPEQTGLVHISGIASGPPPKDDLLRILVDASDTMGTTGQIATFLSGGYRSHFSFEPFSPLVQNNPDIAGAIRRSTEFIRNELSAVPAERT
jgi:2-keto-myo-inositol isomerase